LPSRSSLLLLVAACRHGDLLENHALGAEGLSLSIYDSGDGFTEVVDDRRTVQVANGAFALEIEPSAGLASLLVDGALAVGACHSAEADPASVRCETPAAPGSYRVHVQYQTQGFPYRAQHELRVTAADRATLRSTYVVTTPRWKRTAHVQVFAGLPGGERVPVPLASGEVALDGSQGAVVVPPREVAGRMRRVFDGAMPPTDDLPASDIQWGEASQHVVWVWFELASEHLPPGAIHAIVDVPGELARVAEVTGTRRRDDDEPTRLALFADDEVHGTRKRWHDFSERAELADRFVMTIRNASEEAREVWVEEKLRAPAKRRTVTHAWPKKPGLHRDTLRTKVVVQPGQSERIGYTVAYDF